MTNQRKAAAARRIAAVLPAVVLVFALALGGFTPALASTSTGGLEQAAAGEPVSTLDEVESAVVQIEAVGSFADPAEGMQRNAAGFGSGFIIDPSGIAVTNNHVVTGGALFKVYVSGRDKPVNARVLGVSECSDLAVIDLQGEGYPYLAWYDGRINVGLDVYAAGFPLGDPEFTLTRGIVSKANADGESSWASVDRVIQHDATIHGGNSGGPLVNEHGQVVGVNYATGSQSDQAYAIAADNARPIVEQLAAGENVDSLGLNAEAFDDGEGTFGVFVASVQSGSPADGAGIEPGDILINIEGVDVGAGGVMADYCDIVSSHAASDVLAVQVYRPETKEVLEGQLNGRPLAASINVAETAESDTSLPPAQGAAAGELTYVPVSDEAGTFTIEVPEAWADVQERAWTVADKEIGHQLIASTDLTKFFDEWGIPGVVFSYSDTAQDTYTPEKLLDTIDYSEVCTPLGRKELPADAYYVGSYDEYEACGDSGAAALIFAMTPKEGNFILGIELYAVTEADLAAVDHLLDTFAIGAGGGTGGGGEGGTLLDAVDTSGLAYEYVELNQEALGALIPADWSDIAVGDWVDADNNKIGVYVDAAADVKKYNDYWGVAGLTGFSSTEFGADESPADRLPDDPPDCTFVEEVEHEHTVFGITYTGVYRVYEKCKDSEGNVYRLAAAGGEGENRHLVRIDFVAVDDADQEAWDVLLETFYLPAAVGGAPAPDEPTVNPEEYTEIADASGSIRVAVPTAWTDVDSGPWEIDGKPFGSYLTAAPNLADYEKSWNVPGVWLGLTDQLSGADLNEILDTITLKDECTLDSRYDYEGENFGGVYDLWTKCGGGANNQAATFALYPLDNDQLTVVATVAFNAEGGAAALDRILLTLQVSGAAAAGDATDEAGKAPEEAAPPEAAPPAAPAAPADIYVTINTATLNVRSGPGTNYERIATINQGATLLAIGQYDNCAWLKIEDASGEQGWVSGNAQYTTLEGDCADLPEAAAPPAPAAPAAGSSGQSGAQAGGSSRQGCIYFTNNTGEDLTITFTRKSDNWNTVFQLGKGQAKNQCVDPGKYALTVSTVFGGSLNQDIEIAAGDRIDFPLNY